MRASWRRKGPPRHNGSFGVTKIPSNINPLKPSSPHRRDLAAACALSLLFLAQALVLLPYPGLHTDEALFGSLIYAPRYLDHPVQVFNRPIPLMVMSYLGALKALLYWLWFKVWPPSIYAVRLPVAVAGAISVWLFARLLRETAGPHAAWMGGLLLATSTSFVLLTTFDWGPVALQHLLLLGGLNLLVTFQRRGSRRALAAAFFLFGLAFWDKAIFAWMFSGVALAGLIVFHREIRPALNARHIRVATVAVLAGASPLILYNARSHGSTFQQARLDTADLPGKARQLRSTLEGPALFGYLTREEDGQRRLDPPSRLESAVLALSELAGRPRRSVMPFALASCLLLFPLLGRDARRAVLFATIAMAVAWLQMALTRGAGGSAHHAVLLWPLPLWIVAVTFADLSRRLGRALLIAAAAAVTVIAASSLLVTNEYLAQFVRHGAGPYWSDAMGPLCRRLLATPAGAVVVVDWGILDSVRVLGRGRLPLFQAIDLASREELDDEAKRTLKWLLELPDPVFVGYAPEEREVAPAGERLAAHAARLGFRRETLDFVRDRHGRRVFEVYRFRATSDPGPPQ